jgi:DNA-binding MltR family transcriptional regulator
MSEADAAAKPKYADLIELLGSYRPVLETFHLESDRGAILVASSQLDVCLEEMLASIMVTDVPAAEEASRRLLKGDGPLSTFSSRINVAQCFGLLPHETAAHLHRIRRIRNLCAHSSESVDFNTDGVRDLTNGMWDVDFLVPVEMRNAGGPKLIRARFLMNAAFLLLKLRMAIRHCKARTPDEMWMISAIAARTREEIEQARLELDRLQAELDAKVAAQEAEIERMLADYAAGAGISLEDAREQLRKLEAAEIAPETADDSVSR